MLLIRLQTDALRNMGRKWKYLSGYLNKNQSFHLKTILLTFKLEKKNRTVRSYRIIWPAVFALGLPIFTQSHILSLRVNAVFLLWATFIGIAHRLKHTHMQGKYPQIICWRPQNHLPIHLNNYQLIVWLNETIIGLNLQVRNKNGPKKELLVPTQNC